MNDRLSKDALIRELQIAGATVRGNTVKCIFHDDHNASGSLYQGQDGAWRYKCHASACGFCGDIYDVRAAAQNRPLAMVLKESKPMITQGSPPKVYRSLEEIERMVPGKVEQRFQYTNPDTGKPDLIVLRFLRDGGKSFWQVTPNCTGYYLKSPPKPWPIYNRTRLKDAGQVIVVEGEKCVHALHDAGFVATTSPGGAENAQHADWTPLRGKTVYLWRDNDSAGAKYMRDVGGILDKLSCRLFEIDPTTLSLPEKGDVVEFLARFDSELRHEAIESVLETAEPLGASQELRQVIEETIAGKRKAVSWPWQAVSNLTKALLPGTVTLLCGEPGSSKSFAVIQALVHWHEQGEKVAVFELEEDRAYHLNRMLAQRAGKADLFDPDWIAANGKEALAIHREHQEFLDAVGKCVHAAPDAHVDLDHLAKWAEARAKEGCRIIVIDPVTAAASEALTWIKDQAFMFAVKATARQYGASIVLVTHPKKGRNKKVVSMDDLAGGAAYQRFAQTVLWLEHHKEPVQVTVSSALGRSCCEINRTLHLVKTRNGRGHGLSIGFNFSGNTLTLMEQGVILPEQSE